MDKCLNAHVSTLFGVLSGMGAGVVIFVNFGINVFAYIVVALTVIPCAIILHEIYVSMKMRRKSKGVYVEELGTGAPKR